MEGPATTNSRMLNRTKTIAALASCALLATAASAQAGRFHVYTCRTPAGEVAPADGWSGAVAPGSAANDQALNTCAEHGALVASLGDETAHLSSVDRVTWSFEAPGYAQVAGAVLWRAGYLHGHAGEEGGAYKEWISAPSTGNLIDECLFELECHTLGDITQPLSASNRIAIPSSALGPHMYLNVSCGALMPKTPCPYGFSDPFGYAAVLDLFAADLTLEQPAGPSASTVGGELASAPVISGTSNVIFNAADPGAGVYQAVITIDGQTVQSSVIDENSGHCRDVGQTSDGLPAFLYLQPCKQSLSGADVGFATARVGDGSHHLVVSVTDAAGNSTTLLDRSVVVSNHASPPSGGSGGEAASGDGTASGSGTSLGTGAASGSGAASSRGAGSAGGGGAAAAPAPGPNGVNASPQAALALAWKGTKGTRLTVRYGGRATVTGRLTAPNGAPVSGALIQVSEAPSYLAAQASVMPSVRTDAKGRFTLMFSGALTSRTLTFEYRANGSEPVAAVMRTLTLAVQAGLSLSVAPHRTSVGHSIRFSGRLLGGPLPRGGKSVVLEARSPGGSWIQFKVARTNAAGRFTARYRFRFAGPATYQFRARSEAEADYPYATGSSNAVTVHER